MTATFAADAPAALVELYTSEGCSSCPPADVWLAGLGADKGLWRDFVPVAFHVDYWDYLGWKDVFSSPRHTQRQHAYGREWKVNTVYTPSVVVDGEVWSDWRKKKTLPAKAGSLGKLVAVFEDDGRLVVRGKADACVEAHAAYLVASVTRKIGGGENKGETLTHAFAALDLVDLTVKRDGKGGFVAQGKLARRDVDGGKGYALAAWITPCGSQHPVGAVGGPL